ncbi:MAG TPA: hypothetical protein VFA18_06930, partial [Gemmataceae bacterium]|nr:hypothetical protein [Gemmataceae bacterium]
FLTRIWKANNRSARGPRKQLAATYYRPRVRGFEERIVPSTVVSGVFGATAAQFAPQAPNPTAPTVAPLKITNVFVHNGALFAKGTLGGMNFTTPLKLTASPNTADPTCPILNLTLGAIHLNLLGLNVDTSRICLKITAQSGSGNLLGNLLCDVANLLNQGTSLSSVLNGLTTSQLRSLTNGTTAMLSKVLHLVTTPPLATVRHDLSVTSALGGTCNVLNLTLGPLNLNLLGLNVHLDNCANGPVKVRVTAVPGPGNLLGNLICDLGNLLNSGATNLALENALSGIAGAVGQLI